MGGVLYRKFEENVIEPQRGRRRSAVLTFYGYLEVHLRNEEVLATVEKQLRQYVHTDAVESFDADIAILKNCVFNPGFYFELSCFTVQLSKECIWKL